MAPTPNSALLAAHLREDTADLLALLPAARRAAAGGPGGGEGAPPENAGDGAEGAPAA